jgi:hypothetical protein
MPQIYKTDKTFDSQALLEVYKSLNDTSHQIMITSRGSNDLKEGVGDLRSYLTQEDVTKYKAGDTETVNRIVNLEWEWNHLHFIYKDTAMEKLYECLQKDWIVGRGRFMNMDANNRALTFHNDNSIRLHVPVITNEDSWFMTEDRSMHQMEELGSLYVLDATKKHSALMLSRNKNRVHIVFSAKERTSGVEV